MSILRLIFLFFIGLFVRRLFSRAVKPSSRPSSANHGSSSSNGKSNNRGQGTEPLRDITEQEIDDADFEEIP